MKYETQVQDFKNTLVTAKNVLVVLPSQARVDVLAAGLAFYLSLKQSGKEAAITTESPLLVENGNLFGVGEVKNTFPQAKSGDLVLSLENVVMPDGSVPALEKLDWFPEGSNLNLVFHVVPGQRFEPSKVETKYAGGKFDLIVTIAVTTLTEAGTIYTSNQALFSQTPIVNIDNNAMNVSFGQFKVLDSTAPSLSQMVGQILPDVGLTMDADSASNILTGIYDATKNLTVGVNADTFSAVGAAMQAGGKVSSQSSVISNQTPVVNQPVAGPQPAFQPQFNTTPPVNPAFGATPSIGGATSSVPPIDQAALNQGFDLRAFQPQGPINMTTPASTSNVASANAASASPQPIMPTPPTTPPPVSSLPQPAQPVPTGPVMQGEHEVQPSTPQEQTYEAVGDDSFSPQPDWLTPKVYKGTGGAN